MITTTVQCDRCPNALTFQQYSAEPWHVMLRAAGVDNGWDTTAEGGHTCPTHTPPEGPRP